MIKIGFLSYLNPKDINSWSGTLYHIFHSLNRVYQVEWIGFRELDMIYRKNKSQSNLTRFKFEYYSKDLGKLISERLRYCTFDIIIVRDYFFLAYLDTRIPKIYIGDTTFKLFNDYLKIDDKKFISIADKLEKLSLINADRIIFCSEWAKKSAIEYYGISPNKIHVIEFGANLKNIPVSKFNTKKGEICNLLFIGKNWEEKGGPKAYQTYQILKQKGVNCSFTIIGSNPILDQNDLQVSIIPLLNKGNPNDCTLLRSILDQTHFFILPTKFDCYGIVFCEASAFGIPSLAADVGGVSQVIAENKNGFLFSADVDASKYAEKIFDIYCNNKIYSDLRNTTRLEFKRRLNWEVWLKKIGVIISDLVVFKQENIKKCNDIYIPTYIINLKKRSDRLCHILEQFKGRTEFDVKIIEACEHSNGRIGLWNSIIKIIHLAIRNDDDVIVICEDDHIFTKEYNKQEFFRHIFEANHQGAEILSAGIGGFGSAIRTGENRYWIDWFFCTQFIIVFKSLFEKILSYEFSGNDTADGVLSLLSQEKMVIYPFMSEQANFGYSDVTEHNNFANEITRFFQEVNKKLSVYEKNSK